jgi:hypothetical protein
MSEHDFEPIRGLPGELPEGETILWQGAPDWWRLSGQAFHVRAVAVYFGVMLAWRVSEAVQSGTPAQTAVMAALAVTPLAAVALALLLFLGWLNSRTTVYTITNRRVVMRFGAAIPKAINIPFVIIESAALKTMSGGAGDLALTLKRPNKVPFLQLWPHVRPWKLTSPQPTLRAIPDASGVASVLAGAMRTQVAIELSLPAPIREPRAAAPLGRPEAATA